MLKKYLKSKETNNPPSVFFSSPAFKRKFGVRDMEIIIENVLQYDAICVDFEDIEQEEWIGGYGNLYQRFFSLEDATVLKNGEWHNLEVESPEWDELEGWVAENYPDHL